MSDWFTTFLLLAQEAAPKAEPGAGQGGGIESLGRLWLPMLAIGVLWYFLLIHPQRREQAQRNQKLKALKKNDRVVTIGGIIGTIANVEPDGTEITIKVDDNTRLRMLRTSIQTVLTDDKKDEDESAKKEAKS